MTLTKGLLAAGLLTLVGMNAQATEISFHAQSPAKQTGAIAVAVGANDTLSLSAANLDALTGGAISKAVAISGFDGDLKSMRVMTAPVGTAYDHIILYGTGESGSASDFNLLEIGGHLAQKANGLGVTSLTIEVDTHAEDAARMAMGVDLGNYQFNKYMSDTDRHNSLVNVSFSLDDAANAEDFFAKELSGVADSVMMARDLVSEPANVIYPETFVDHARASLKGLPVKIKVLDVSDMTKLGMGAILGVGKGSVHPPRMMIVTYMGADDKDEAPVAFVGKGITFDTGGIDIKGSNNLWAMKGDMAGAATAIATVRALASRGAKVNAVGIAALAENMPGGRAQHPGDVVTTMSGKTIDVGNTDAEGRLVLADGVFYAQEKFSPRLLVDVATLTGSVRRALGDEYAGLFSRHDALAQQLLAAGEKTGEELWRLPLHPNHLKTMKSDIADIKSTGTGPGASVGAQAIGFFVDEDVNWAHLDIAGKGLISANTPIAVKGATGYAVRLLDQLIRDHYEGQ